MGESSAFYSFIKKGPVGTQKCEIEEARVLVLNERKYVLQKYA